MAHVLPLYYFFFSGFFLCRPLLFLPPIPPSNLILCCPLLLLPLIFPSIRVFNNESVLRIRWPEYWSVTSPAGSQASSRGEAKDSALLSSRDAGLLEPPERPEGKIGLPRANTRGRLRSPS